MADDDAFDFLLDAVEAMQRRAEKETDPEKKRLLHLMGSNLNDEIDDKGGTA